MSIAAFCAAPFAIPYKRPLALATGKVTEHRAVLVSITDDQGRCGRGELAPGPGTTAAVIDSLALRAHQALQALAELAIEDTEDVRVHCERLHPVVRPACEAALLDLAAQRALVPLHRLLGSTSDAPSTVRVNAMIDRAPPEEALATANEAIDSGYATLKIKVDRNGLDECIELLTLLRREHGDSVALRLDCNGSWPLDTATDAMRALEGFDLEYVEQPTHSLPELAQLRKVSAVPIAADESVADLNGVRAALDIGAADILIVKPARLGLFDAVEAARLARRTDVRIVVTSNLDTSLGTAAALHLARAIDGDSPRYAHGLGTVALLDGDLCGAEDALIAHRGGLTVPSTSGCGVTIDSGLVDRWRSE